MNNIIPAGQTYAYDLYKKKIKLPKEKSKVKHWIDRKKTFFIKGLYVGNDRVFGIQYVSGQ